MAEPRAAENFRTMVYWLILLKVVVGYLFLQCLDQARDGFLRPPVLRRFRNRRSGQPPNVIEVPMAVGVTQG